MKELLVIPPFAPFIFSLMKMLVRRIWAWSKRTMCCWLVLAGVCFVFGLFQGFIPCRVPGYIAISMHSNNRHYSQSKRDKTAQCGTFPRPRVQYIAYSVGDFEETYARNLELLQCQAARQGVPFRLLNPYDYKECAHLQDVYFLRHCVTAIHLKCADYTFSLDLDVIPQNDFDWEQYLTEYDLVFSQAFEGNEIAAGTFLVRNSQYSKQFLMEWSEYEKWQKCWNANGDQVPLHHLLMEKVKIHEREKAECHALMEKQKWTYEVQQWIRCAVWWIRVGTQWSKNIYLTNMADALTVTVRDYNAENILVEYSPLPLYSKDSLKTGISLPLSRHPFLHGIKPKVLAGLVDWTQWENCSAMGDKWALPWFPVTKIPLSLPPYPRGFARQEHKQPKRLRGGPAP